MFARLTSKSLVMGSASIAQKVQGQRFLAQTVKSAAPKTENQKMADIWLNKWVDQFLLLILLIHMRVFVYVYVWMYWCFIYSCVLVNFNTNVFHLHLHHIGRKHGQSSSLLVSHSASVFTRLLMMQQGLLPFFFSFLLFLHSRLMVWYCHSWH